MLPHFFIALLALGKLRTNITMKIPFLLYNPILKPFFKKILEIFRLLLITFRVSLKKFSISIIKSLKLDILSLISLIYFSKI